METTVSESETHDRLPKHMTCWTDMQTPSRGMQFLISIQNPSTN